MDQTVEEIANKLHSQFCVPDCDKTPEESWYFFAEKIKEGMFSYEDIVKSMSIQSYKWPPLKG